MILFTYVKMLKKLKDFKWIKKVYFFLQTARGGGVIGKCIGMGRDSEATRSRLDKKKLRQMIERKNEKKAMYLPSSTKEFEKKNE